MSIEQLNERRNILLAEQASLQEEANSNSVGSAGNSRLAEIATELSTIQKALIANWSWCSVCTYR